MEREFNLWLVSSQSSLLINGFCPKIMVAQDWGQMPPDPRLLRLRALNPTGIDKYNGSAGPIEGYVSDKVNRPSPIQSWLQLMTNRKSYQKNWRYFQ